MLTTTAKKFGRSCEDCGGVTYAKTQRRCTRCQKRAATVRREKRMAQRRAAQAAREGQPYVCRVCRGTYVAYRGRTICPSCAAGAAPTDPDHPAYRPRAPRAPTTTAPGSEDRIAVYAARAAKGQQLHHPKDQNERHDCHSERT